MTKDWPAFINSLEGAELVEAAEDANTAAFVRVMKETHSAAQIHDVLVLFARRFRALGQVPPRGGYVDLEWLADTA